MAKEQVTHVEDVIDTPAGPIVNVLDDPSIYHAAIIFSKEGMWRSNHYHPVQEQWLYCIYGRFMAVCEDIKTKERHEQVVEVGDILITPPNVAHYYMFLERTCLLFLGTGDRRPEGMGEHTIQYKVV